MERFFQTGRVRENALLDFKPAKGMEALKLKNMEVYS